jgi:hypothetical protein
METPDSSKVPSLTRQDVQQSLACYGDLLKVSTKYYRKFLELAQTASEFAQVLENMGKCKGTEQSGASFLPRFV